MISFKTTKEDAIKIVAIARRACMAAKAIGVKIDMMEMDMDITACHSNGCPLKLDDLLIADDSNFLHDVFGIRRHIDRKTGQLGGCFLPRFADLKIVA